MKIVVGLGEGASDGALVLRLRGCSSVGNGVTGTVGVGPAEGGTVPMKIVVGLGEGASDGALVLRLRGCSSVGAAVAGSAGVGDTVAIEDTLAVGLGEGAMVGCFVLRLRGCSSVGDMVSADALHVGYTVGDRLRGSICVGVMVGSVVFRSRGSGLRVGVAPRLVGAGLTPRFVCAKVGTAVGAAVGAALSPRLDCATVGDVVGASVGARVGGAVSSPLLEPDGGGLGFSLDGPGLGFSLDGPGLGFGFDLDELGPYSME
jgi:hypothetical protein